jgi:hypothetical protein
VRSFEMENIYEEWKALHKWLEMNFESAGEGPQLKKAWSTTVKDAQAVAARLLSDHPDWQIITKAYDDLHARWNVWDGKDREIRQFLLNLMGWFLKNVEPQIQWKIRRRKIYIGLAIAGIATGLTALVGGVAWVASR